MPKGNSINFHETFRPERQYILAILELVSDGISRTAREISKITGIPSGTSSGKVVPHIYYASYMGLVSKDESSNGYKIRKTNLGELITREDPGLQETLTTLMLHCMILRNVNGARMWSVIFRRILPNYREGIRKETLIKELNAAIEENVVAKNIAPFFGSYDTFFDSLGILNVHEDVVSVSKMPFDKEFIYLYAYVLFEYWDEEYPEQREISSGQLESMHYRIAYGWSKEDEYMVLEQLCDKGIIRLNRQLMPFLILRLVEKESLLDLLYSELC